MKNGLYIVSTPIGNLGDISSRAIKTLGESDIIICENPKHTVKKYMDCLVWGLFQQYLFL